MMDDGRIIMVSNAEPYSHRYNKQGEIVQEKLPGGLTTGLDPLMQAEKGCWIAWGRGEADFAAVDGNNKVMVPDKDGYELKRVSLTEEEINGFYYGFANETLWPIAHSFVSKAKFNPAHWKSYRRVNQKYTEAVIEEITDKDYIWAHDYHLTLLPEMIRKKKPDTHIAFFWHIPWPSWESFGTIPWKKEILEGLLASDFIGFHTTELVRNFLECVGKIGAEVERLNNTIIYKGHTTRVKALPLGVDAGKFQRLADNPEMDKKAKEIYENCHAENIIFGVDRLDYTKGILKRLQAIDKLFQKYPEYIGRVTLVQRVSPSRTEVEEYKNMREEINRTIGDINGRYSRDEWIPIKYFSQSVPQEDLLPYFRAADIALITPLIDGMNLVAKEYVATTDTGVLILSEFAGAAEQFNDADLVNPYHIEEVAETIHRALCRDEVEKRKRMNVLKKKVREYDINWWREEFLREWIKSYE